VSAQNLQRSLAIGSYQTAWPILHRFRSTLIRPGGERLSGIVEVDETFIGGEEPGLRVGRAKSKTSLVAVAVELREPKGSGRCRMTITPDASGASLQSMIADRIESGWQVACEPSDLVFDLGAASTTERGTEHARVDEDSHESSAAANASSSSAAKSSISCTMSSPSGKPSKAPSATTNSQPLANSSPDDCAHL
jgi:hypothetical protein